MAKTNLNGHRSAYLNPGLKLSPKRRRFRDPRLRWMDQLLRSFEKPASEAWIPTSYQYLFRQAKKPCRPIH